MILILLVSLKIRGTSKATSLPEEKPSTSLNIEAGQEKFVFKAKLFWQRDVKGIRAGRRNRDINVEMWECGYADLGAMRTCARNDISPLRDQHRAMGRTWSGGGRLRDPGAATSFALNLSTRGFKMRVGPDRLCGPP